MKKIIIILLSFITLLTAADLTIGFTGNNRGLLEPCGCTIPAGGYARISTAISQIKNDHIQVGVGNHFFHHTPIKGEDQIFEQKKAYQQAAFMKDLNFQVINVGQFDVCYGLKPLKQIEKHYGLSLISANLCDESGDLVFQPYKILQFKDRKIMFVGICQFSDGFDFTIKNPLQTLTQLKDDGEFEKADLVILLADATSKMLSDFVKNNQGIDIIVAAKEHKFTSLPMHFNKTPLVQLGSQGKYLGKLDLNFNKTNEAWKDLSIYHYYIEEALQEIEQDPKKKSLRNKLKSHRKKLRRQIKAHPNHYRWHMDFLDENIEDDVKIKDQVEALIERKL